MPVTICVALVALIVVSPSRAADGGGINLPVYDVPTQPHGSARGADAASTGAASGQSVDRGRNDMARPAASFSLVELPPDASMPGSGYKRPHHAVGYRWQAAESWLRDHGFDAQTCYLPMVRMHTKLAPGATAGTLWVYGRCTFR